MDVSVASAAAFGTRLDLEDEVFGPDALDPAIATALAATAADRGPARELSPFEFLPGWLTYGPVVVQWIALGLRYGDFSLPTAANPRITTGGLCGESKSAILDEMQGAPRSLVAPYVTMVTGACDPTEARLLMREAGLSLPLVIKPDIGCNGTGVRLVESEAELDLALASFPRNVRLMLQRLIPWECEAGIFYIRHPNDAAGHISSLTLKHAPMVIGDGVSSLRALIEADPRHRRLKHLYLARLGAALDRVPEEGERVRLVFAGNHCKGSIFRNGASDITPALTARIDEVARAMPDFHFGRIDVRFRSLADLRDGRDFAIIEINGVGSEATHIWDPDTSLREVFAAQFHHYGTAFEIGREMRRRGARPSGALTMLRDWLNQRRLLASYPLND
jgi:hypothetical protein